MDGQTFVINGGNELFGRVELYGAKNAVLPMLAAALLSKEDVTIEDCPHISDVFMMTELLRDVGAEVSKNGRNICVSGQAHTHKISKRLEKVMRSSMFMLGVLLATVGEVELSLPGGCNIGARPLDIHLDGLSRLGAVCEEREGRIYCRADKLVGAKIILRYPSVGATENLIMASVLAKGKTTLINCAREPEIVSLVGLLKKMGANVTGEGTSVIEIVGTDSLGGATYKPVTDRIVAGTYLGALGACGGEITIDGATKKSLSATICQLGADFELFDDEVSLCARAKKPKAFCYDQNLERVACDLTTGPYPLFATDMQPIVCATRCILGGVTKIRETVFENRFSHLVEMQKLGANVHIEKDVAYVSRGHLHAGEMIARDLRGGAGLAVFAMGIKGESRVLNAKFVDRGYEDFEGNFSKLGCAIYRT